MSQGRKTTDVPFQVSFPLNLAFTGRDISIRKLQNSQEKKKQTSLFPLLSVLFRGMNPEKRKRDRRAKARLGNSFPIPSFAMKMKPYKLPSL